MSKEREMEVALSLFLAVSLLFFNSVSCGGGGGQQADDVADALRRLQPSQSAQRTARESLTPTLKESTYSEPLFGVMEVEAIGGGVRSGGERRKEGVGERQVSVSGLRGRKGSERGVIVGPHPSSHETTTQTTPATGSLSVNVNDLDGTMYLSIPLRVPLGTAGMQPRLSLSFSSSGGENHYGTGWDLEGLSSIYRCPRSFAQDPINAPVDFSNYDRFCVDGSRMIAITGERGLNEVHYRTETDSFSDIISYTNNGDEPAYWVLYTSAGIMRTYGNTSDSRILTKKGTRSWALNRAIDLAGNYIDYVYDQLTFDEYVISEILYTANDLNSNVGALSPYSSKVAFSYESRSEFGAYEIYMTGEAVWTSLLCTKISTFTMPVQPTSQNDWIPIYDYNLVYVSDPFIWTQARLASVTQCAHDTDGTVYCNNPYDLTYTNIFGAKPSDVAYVDVQTSISDALYSDSDTVSTQMTQIADFNGDGVSDILYLSFDLTAFNSKSVTDTPATVEVYLATLDANNRPTFGSPIEVTGFTVRKDFIDTDVNRFQLVDWNNDGCMDLYVVSPSSLVADSIYLFNKKDGFLPPIAGPLTVTADLASSGQYAGLDISRYKFGDFDGNGFVDVYLLNFPTTGGDEAQDTIYLNFDGSSTINIAAGLSLPKSAYSDSTNAQTDCTRYKVQDINGDGISDIYFVDGEDNNANDTSANVPGKLYLGPLNDNKWTMILGPPMNYNLGDTNDAISTVNFGDFNGDGFQDIFIVSVYEHQSSMIYYFDGVQFRGTALNNEAFPPCISSRKMDATGERERKGRKGSGDTYNSEVIGAYHFVEMNGDGCTDIYITQNTERCSITTFQDTVYYSTRRADIHTFVKASGVRKKYTLSNDFDVSRVLFGDFNGDGMLDVYYINGSQSTPAASHIYLAPNNQTFLTKVTSPHGVPTTFEYRPISWNGVYTKGTSAVYPNIDFQGPHYVMTSLTRDLGYGYYDTTLYYYESAVQNQRGWGFLGFGHVKANQTRTGLLLETYYLQDVNAHLQMYEDVEVVTARDGTMLHYYETSYNSTMFSTDDGVYWSILPIFTHDVSWDLDGSYMGTTNTSSQYDAYGNVLMTISTSSDDYVTLYSERYESDYFYDTDRWYFNVDISRTHKELHTDYGISVNDITTNSSYDTRGLLSGQCSRSNLVSDNDMSLCTFYTLDIFGNRFITSIEGQNIDGTFIEPRNSSSEYDDLYGRYLTATVDAIGLTMRYKYEERCDAIQSSLAPGMTTSADVTYSAFCLPISQTFTDGSVSTVSYSYCDSSCPKNASLKVTSTSTIGVQTVNYIDANDRLMRTVTPGFKTGSSVTYDLKYGDNGKISQVSTAYYSGDKVYWTSYTYDDLDRVVKTTYADGSVSSVEYKGPVVTNVNALGQRDTNTMNILQQIVQTENNDGMVMTFQYGTLGEILKSIDPYGNNVTAEYDGFGNRLSLFDPNLGEIAFEYDVLGNILEQKWDQPITFTYDLIGRPVTRYNGSMTSYFTYNQFGKMASATVGRYYENYTYDSIGRIIQKEVLFDLTGNHVFMTNATYDQYSRVETSTFPSGFSVQNKYDSRSGHLTEVIEVGTNRVIYQVVAKNADNSLASWKVGGVVSTNHTYDVLGRLTSIYSLDTTHKVVLQNLTYKWDSLGNLLSRTSALSWGYLQELFQYDTLNRLIVSTIYTNHTFTHNTTLTYDAIGNILSNSDVGTYEYNAAMPHAVTNIEGPTKWEFFYGGRGNMYKKQETASGVRVQITENVDNRVDLMEYYNSQGQLTRHSTFEYGPLLTPIRRVDYNDDNGSTSRKVFYGDSFERNQLGANGDEVNHEDMAYYGSVFFHMLTADPNDKPLSQNYYAVLRDHIGSVDVVVDLDSLVIINRQSYSYSGNPRNPLTWMGTDWGNQFDGNIEQGYSSHLKLVVYSMTLMGNRLYDPMVGRFMSPDPHCAALGNMQALNKYSYVSNRPLSDADPTGYDGTQHAHPVRHLIFKFFRKLARRVVDALLLAACGGPECMALFDAGVAIVADKIEGKSWKSAFADGAAHFLSDEFAGAEPNKRVTGALGKDGAALAQKLAGGFIMGINNVDHGGGFASGFADGYVNGFGTTFQDDFTISTHAENHFKKGEWVAGALDVAKESADQQIRSFVSKEMAKYNGIKPNQLRAARLFIQYGDLAPYSQLRHLGKADYTKLGNAAFFMASHAQHSFAAIDPLVTIFGHQINGGNVLANAATNFLINNLQHGPPEAAVIAACGFFRSAIPTSSILHGIPGLMPGVNEIIGTNSAVTFVCLGINLPMTSLHASIGGASEGVAGSPHGDWSGYSGSEYPIDLWGKDGLTIIH